MMESTFGDQYLATKKRVFNVAERKISLSGDSFDIRDENSKFLGDPWLQRHCLAVQFGVFSSARGTILLARNS